MSTPLLRSTLAFRCRHWTSKGPSKRNERSGPSTGRRAASQSRERLSAPARALAGPAIGGGSPWRSCRIRSSRRAVWKGGHIAKALSAFGSRKREGRKACFHRRLPKTVFWRNYFPPDHLANGAPYARAARCCGEAKLDLPCAASTGRAAAARERWQRVLFYPLRQAPRERPLRAHSRREELT